MKKLLVVATLSIAVAAVIKRVAGSKCVNCREFFKNKELLVLDNNDKICDLCAGHMSDMANS